LQGGSVLPHALEQMLGLHSPHYHEVRNHPVSAAIAARLNHRPRARINGKSCECCVNGRNIVVSVVHGVAIGGRGGGADAEA
jgi:hypothetical protein